MIQLLDRFNMARLFNSDLPMLKLFFYQLDRLVSIFEPDLHSHFKDEMINSSYFASAWFITIFTNSIKHTVQGENEAEVSERLLQLWDYFLVSGWKAILKMGLFVLKDSSGELLQLSFEEILNEITEKPKAILVPKSVVAKVSDNEESEESKDQVALSTDGEEVEIINLYQLLRMSFRRENG